MKITVIKIVLLSKTAFSHTKFYQHYIFLSDYWDFYM